MGTKDVDLIITGSPEGLEAALATAKAAVRGAVGEMERSFGGLQSALATAQRAMLAFTAVLGGGAAFKAAVDATVNLSKESVSLGRSLGIGASQASVLHTALGDVYATADQVTSATSKIAQTLNTDEQSFGRLGVATRDANGNFRNTFDILLDVNGRLSQLKEGTDRNIAGLQIYGKSWSTVEPLIRLNAKAMDEAARKGRELGLVIGVEDVEATRKYRAAMNDVGDVMLALQKTIGDALLPSLTATAEWFSEAGPNAIKSMRIAIAELATAFVVLKVGFKVAAETLGAVAAQLVEMFVAMGKVLSRALVGDFSGAAAAWDNGLANMTAIGEAWVERLVAIQKEGALEVADAWDAAMRPGGKTPAAAPPGGDTGPPTDESTKSRLTGWQTGLDEAKAAFSEQRRIEGSFREFSQSEELVYWQNILATQRTSTQEQLALRSKIATLSLAIDKDKFGAEIENLKSEEAAFRQNGEARLALAQQVAERMRQAYGDDSKEYAAARKDVIATERQIQDQLTQIRQQQAVSAQNAALADVDAATNGAREAAALMLITQEELLAAEEAFEQRRFEIRQQALQQSLQLALSDPDRNPVEVARILAEIESLEQQHQERMREFGSRKVLESNKEWLGALRQMEGGFKSALAGMMKGQLTFAEGMKQMTSSVVGAIIDMYAQMAAEWLVAQLAQLVMTKSTTGSKIAAHAAEAGAAGTASWAGAPWPVNMGAPSFGLAMAGAAASFGAGLAAEGGFDVPSGLNPVTQLHQREMVLPAYLADEVRNAAGGGGGRQGPVIIQAMDQRSVERWAKNPANRRALYDAVAAHSGARFGPRRS